jgi:hypothetical protein
MVMYFRKSLPILILAVVLLVSSCANPYYHRRTKRKRGCGCPGGFSWIEQVDCARASS